MAGALADMTYGFVCFGFASIPMYIRFFSTSPGVRIYLAVRCVFIVLDGYAPTDKIFCVRLSWLCAYAYWLCAYAFWLCAYAGS